MKACRAKRAAAAWWFVVAAVCAPAGGYALGPRVEQRFLRNGATLLVSDQHSLPMVLVRVLIDAGARRDPEGLGGLAYLTADLLTEGTSTRSADQINEAIDFIGGSLGSSADMDYAYVGVRTLAKDLDAGLDLLSDALLHPAFAAGEIARRREAVLATIQAERDNPTTVAARAFRPALFGREPYGHPVHGTEETVRRIRDGDLRHFYEQFYRPGRALIIVVGDITADAAQERVERALSTWGGPAAPEFRYPAPASPESLRIRIDKPVTQAAVFLGHRGIARDNPDHESVTVMNYILGGGGFSSRLMESIRTRAGLVYSVGSGFAANKDPGIFTVVMQTKNESVAEAIALARAEIDRIRTEPVSDAELDEAKRYLTGNFPLRMDSNEKVAGLLAEFAFYGLGFDYPDRYVERVNAVTTADVLRVAQRYVRPEELIEVVVADLGKVDAAPTHTPAH